MTIIPTVAGSPQQQKPFAVDAGQIHYTVATNK